MTPMALAGTGLAEGFSIGGAVTSAGEIFTSCLGFLTGNPIFVVFIGAALIPIGFHIFSSAKNSVR